MTSNPTFCNAACLTQNCMHVLCFICSSLSGDAILAERRTGNTLFKILLNNDLLTNDYLTIVAHYVNNILEVLLIKFIISIEITRHKMK